MAYPWADQLSPDDRVSSDTGYSVGDYLPLFEEHEYVCDACRLRYYLYDPFAHGTAPHGPCKVILALHGAGNALSGKVAVNYAAAEHFASPQRQAALGGAYILVPMANETRAADGHAQGTWATFEGEAHPEQYSARVQSLIPAMGPRFAARLGTQSVYTAPLLGLMEDFRRSHPQAGPVLLMGTSAGGYGAWSLLQAAPERFAGAILMGAAHLPPTTVVDDLIRRDAGRDTGHSHLSGRQGVHGAGGIAFDAGHLHKARHRVAYKAHKVFQRNCHRTAYHVHIAPLNMHKGARRHCGS